MVGMGKGGFDDVIARIYDAALDPERWPIIEKQIHAARRRPRSRGPPDLVRMEFFDRLTPHIVRAWRVRDRLAELESQRRIDRAIRDRLLIAIILLDERHRIVELNHAAKKLVAAGDGLMTQHKRLRAVHPVDASALDRLIASAIRIAMEGGMERNRIIALRRPSLRRSLYATVTPIRRVDASHHPGSDLSPPVALVTVEDPEVARAPAAESLQRLLGLTPAEARLAAAFAGGDSLRDYAEAAGLSLNYVRWLLKQIQAKTGTRSEVELMRLLTRHAALLATSA